MQVYVCWVLVRLEYQLLLMNPTLRVATKFVKFESGIKIGLDKNLYDPLQ